MLFRPPTILRLNIFFFLAKIEINKLKIIAVSGVARAGKDTIANGLASVLKDIHPNFNIFRASFAEDLKAEVYDFVLDKFGIDVFEADGEEKAIIRHVLVGHGKARRQQTKGRYWLERVEKKIHLLQPDVTIISDLRFAEEEADELFWLKNLGGKLIHVSRFKLNNGKKQFVQPPNADEKLNDPLLKKAADFRISWQDSKDEKELKEMTKNFCEDFYYNHISFFQ